MRKKAVIYIHGKGGNAEEAERYKTLFPSCEVMCLGMSTGCSFGYSQGIELSLGLLFGLTIGSCIKKENESERKGIDRIC